jgi:hypothetical protein
MATLATLETAGMSLGEHAYAALRSEFGAVLASRMLEAEAADFHWQARIRERYLGQYLDGAFGSGDPDEELSRVAIMSRIDGYEHVGVCLVDGDGEVAELLWLRSYSEHSDAEDAFDRAH